MIIKKRVIADTEIKGTYRYKPTGKAVWVMREDEDFWRPWGCRDWTEEELNKYKPEFKEKGWKDVILMENDGTDPNDVLIHDAYGQEILADKAWDAYEAVKELMGAQRLLLSFELAIGADELKEITEALNEEWNEDGLDLDELAAIADTGQLIMAVGMYQIDLFDLQLFCQLALPEIVHNDQHQDQQYHADRQKSRNDQFLIALCKGHLMVHDHCPLRDQR